LSEIVIRFEKSVNVLTEAKWGKRVIRSTVVGSIDGRYLIMTPWILLKHAMPYQTIGNFFIVGRLCEGWWCEQDTTGRNVQILVNSHPCCQNIRDETRDNENDPKTWFPEKTPHPFDRSFEEEFSPLADDRYTLLLYRILLRQLNCLYKLKMHHASSQHLILFLQTV
jgi:hypothetical protein